jgi:hypothetical protein
LNHQLTEYCERTDSSFWAEPLNAISNISFIIAGFLIIYLYKKYLIDSKKAENSINYIEKDFNIIILSLLSITVGIGSFLYHTFHTQLTILGDLIPIAIFSFYTLYIGLRKNLEYDIKKSILFLIGFGLIMTYSMFFMDRSFMNGSIIYLPVPFALLYFSIFAKNKKKEWIISTILFSFALLFRTIDSSICGINPHGTHFLWHLINGFTFFFMIKATMLIKER